MKKRFSEAQNVRDVIDSSFLLRQAAESHRALSQHYLGKLALRPTI